MTALSLDGLVEQFVGDLDFEVLIIWADVLKVDHDEDSWLDDEYPDRENELRVGVAEALGNVGVKK